MPNETKTAKIDVKALFEKLSWRDIRNALFGTVVVFGGLGLAFVTLWAHQVGNPRMAGAAAVASLVFVVLILLFVVPPLARSASREVSQVDLPIEITTGGLIFLGIVAIVAFAAWNTGNNLLFLVLSFLLATLVVSFSLGGTNLKKLEAKVRFPEAIFVAQPTIFSIALKNRKFLIPTFSVALALRGSMTDDPFGGREFVVRPPEVLARFLRLPWLRKTVGYFIHVPRRASAEQQTEQLFSVRGRFIIKDFELSTKFPFGFWQRRKRLKVRETDIFIFPQLTSLNDLAAGFAPNAGQFAAARRGAGQDLLGLREYQPADDKRSVDWKATARTGSLTVREYAAEDERRVTIAFDSRLQSENQIEEVTDRFERGVSVAAALLDYYIGEGANVRLLIDGEGGGFANDKTHFYESLRRLAVVEPKFAAAEKTDSAANWRDSDLTIFVAAQPKDVNAATRQAFVSY